MTCAYALLFQIHTFRQCTAVRLRSLSWSSCLVRLRHILSIGYRVVYHILNEDMRIFCGYPHWHLSLNYLLGGSHVPLMQLVNLFFKTKDTHVQSRPYQRPVLSYSSMKY
jgi:hypothetical protein